VDGFCGCWGADGAGTAGDKVGWEEDAGEVGEEPASFGNGAGGAATFDLLSEVLSSFFFLLKKLIVP